MLRRGCALTLALFAGLFVVYLLFFTQYFEWPGNLIAAGFGSLFGAAGVGSVSNRYQASRQNAAFERAARGESPRGGQLTAVTGPIRPLGLTIRTPFTDVPCVAYEYDVFEETRTSRGHKSPKPHDLTGFAMAASAIDTPHGAVRLLGFPILDEFGKTRHRGADLRSAAERYLAATPFEAMHKTGRIFKFAAAVDDAVQDADGVVRKDFRLTAGDIPFDQRVITERIVRPGDDVVALGRYDEAQRALVPRGTTMNQLWPGTLESVRRHVVGTAVSNARIGLTMFLVTHAGLALAFYLSETRHARESSYEQANVIKALVSDGDIAGLERAVRRGADPNARDSLNTPVIFDVRDPAMIPVLVRLGADVNVTDGEDVVTPLIRAVQIGDVRLVRALLAAGANVHAQSKDGDTALSEAMRMDYADIAAVLRAAGAGKEVPLERR